MAIYQFFNIVFDPLLRWSPFATLLIISFLVTLITTLVYKFLTNQEVMRSLKEEMKGFQKEIKTSKDNPQKMMELQKKAMEKNLKYMMHSFKPMLITFIPLLIVFIWLKSVYSNIGPLLFGINWLWIYLISAIVFSIVLRKLLKVH